MNKGRLKLSEIYQYAMQLAADPRLSHDQQDYLAAQILGHIYQEGSISPAILEVYKLSFLQNSNAEPPPIVINNFNVVVQMTDYQYEQERIRRQNAEANAAIDAIRKSYGC